VVDRVAHHLDGVLLGGLYQWQILLDAGAGSTFTDYEFDVSLTLEKEVSSGSYPGQDSPDLLFSWQLVSNPGSPTALTSANANSGPWLWSGAVPMRSNVYSTSLVATGVTIWFYTITGGHKLWFPQTPGPASDLWLQILSGWPSFYGNDPTMSISITSRYFGP
jgi:hypothetical protein